MTSAAKLAEYRNLPASEKLAQWERAPKSPERSRAIRNFRALIAQGL